MGKKTKRQRGTAKTASNRREVIQARRQPKDPRTKANELREEFVRLSNNQLGPRREHNREIALNEYVDFIGEKLQESPSNALNFVTKEDRSFLMGIYRNTQEVPLFRAHAVALWGEISFSNCEQGDACLCMQLAIKICKQSMESGQSIDLLQEMCLNYLNEWFHSGTESYCLYAGNQCDWCGKLVQEYGVDFLACCGRCKLSHYCSVECQKMDWKEGGHKMDCRKKGAFSTGDTVVFADPSGPLPFDSLVVLLAPVPCDHNKSRPEKWLVEGENCCIAPAENLRRVRPKQWCTNSSMCHAMKRRALDVIVASSTEFDSKAASLTANS